MNSNIIDLYKTLNILCVEDDIDVLETYKGLFSLMFQKVYFASDGLEGITCFKENNIDIILTDYQMPRCNGLDMSREIRKVDSSIPIVMVTALESIEMLREAIDLNITSFLKKPFTSESLFSTFNLAVKSVIVDRYILKEQTQKILYSHYQENLTFDKEQIITKNDLQESKKLFDFNCEVFYRPKDILSGDSFIIRELHEDEIVIFIVDGMGKGISASVTAMLCSAYVNYYITHTLENQYTFCLENLLSSLLKFIQPNLLEYEVISANFLHFKKDENRMHYAIFSMPPPLYMLENDDNTYKIKSNNTPLASYTEAFTVDTLEISELSKMLIYSDGLNENTLKDTEEFYTTYLKNDFKKAENSQEFQALYEQKVAAQEDDITYILLTKPRGDKR
jgi:CheY-like chemotaxis protein